MKTILVTGGAGFIGSNFVRYMLRGTKSKIINLDKLTYSGNLANLKDVENDPRYEFVKGDICDRNLIFKIAKRCEAIINFAAESHVDRSIKSATEFIRTNVLGTQALLDAAKQHGVKRFIQISCYDKETKALTTEGLKTYKELKKGDRVFSLNPKTFKIEVKPIEKVIIQSYRGKMIHFNNKRINLLVTPNHNMFILNRGRNKRKLLVENAEKVAKRSIFYMPSGQWTGRKEEYFHIKNYGKVKTKDLMYILGIFVGDGFIAYQEREFETKTGLARKEYLKKSRDVPSGRFKSIEKQGNHRTICHGYRIFIDIPENDRCRKRVEKTLCNLGIKYQCHKGKAGTHLYFTSKALMEFFKQYGEGAYNKHIPRWALDCAPEYLLCLLQGLMDSDGNSYGNIYFTVSRRLVSDICELAIKLNLKPSIYEKHSRSFMGKRKIEGRSYYIFIAKTTKSISRHKNSIVDYSGDIWCLKVKDNKNFVVERNGKLDFCGNTDEVYGSIAKGTFHENSPPAPNSPYAASKASADLLARSYFVTHTLPVIILRSSNNFGPWQYPEKIIPLFITNAMENKKLPVYADGSNVREWLYVLDNCDAINFILNRGKIGEIYNIGSGNEMRNIELTKRILDLLGKAEGLIKFVKDRPGHDKRYALNFKKLKALGWKPKYKFENALKETVLWYKENTKWWKRLKKRKEEKFW